MPNLRSVYSKKFRKPDSLKMGQEDHLSGELPPRESLLMFVNHHICFGDLLWLLMPEVRIVSVLLRVKCKAQCGLFGCCKPQLGNFTLTHPSCNKGLGCVFIKANKAFLCVCLLCGFPDHHGTAA